MNIIFGEDAKNSLGGHYTVLELDTFALIDRKEQVTAYCVVQNIPLQDFPILDALVKVHHDMIQAYKEKNWEYCLSAVRGLAGKWNGELDTFYEDLYQRLIQLQETNVDPGWSHVREYRDYAL